MVVRSAPAIGRLIFSRRATQERLSELDEVLAPKQRADLVKRLNRAHRDRLSAVWETVVMAACNRVAPVTHERTLESGRRPDITFTYQSSSKTIRVVADVAAASDGGLRDNNPFHLYWVAVERRVKKRRLNWGRFRFDVRGGHSHKGPIKLWIPPRSELDAFIRNHVDRFLDAIRRDPEKRAVLEVRDPGVHVDVTYDPATIHPGASHTSFDQSHSLTRNPVYSALENKTDQLRAVDEEVLRGVVLCDAGCACMKPLMNPGSARSLDEIVKRFLHSTSSIDFVVTISVEKEEPWSSQTAFRLRVWLYAPDRPARRHVADQQALVALNEFFEKVAACLPRPVQDAENAYLQCDRPGLAPGLHGGYRVGGKLVRMSSRQLVEILANGWDPFGKAITEADAAEVRISQRFAWMMENGFTIERVEVIRNDDKDDDWVDVHFAGPDPAISPYR